MSRESELLKEIGKKMIELAAILDGEKTIPSKMDGQDVDKVYAIIRFGGNLTRSELARKCYWIRSAILDQIVKKLIKNGLVESVEIPTTRRGGRPGTIYHST